ncbi:MAG: AAA family ATPase [Archangium sp.]
MHVVTFYSFKGGVGRTLALANVALELVRRGRRVLVVDFDLEAPGLTTLPAFSAAQGRVGIVDFVDDYRRSKVAPEVRNYLSKCDTVLDGQLWFMSAGKNDPGYASRLASIDWRKLYDDEDGYLLFEDLKAQWRQFAQPDYVLIDSRTGHTDVAGVCTRHLADAIVALFLPNAPNILGLGRVVSEIRSEGRHRKHPQEIYFVASNVPRLDDENEILSAQMTEARAVFGTEKFGTIHHYDALALLQQSVFVIDRRKTLLAREYIELVDTVVRGNLDDREGALSLLRESLNRQSRTNLSDEVLDRIAEGHSKDGEVLGALGRVFESRGDYASAFPYYSRAIDAGSDVAEMRVRRATTHRILNRPTDAVADLREVASRPAVDESNYARALLSLAELDPAWFGQAPLRALSEGVQLRVAQALMGQREHLGIAERFLRAQPNASIDPSGQLVLCLIGQRKFQEALELIRHQDDFTGIAAEFNQAICIWGVTGTPPVERFETVLAMHSSSGKKGANYFQCMAMVAIVLNRQELKADFLREARRWIRELPRKTFSSWRYLELNVDQFVHDLDEIEAFDLRVGRPPFLPEQEELFPVLRDSR